MLADAARVLAAREELADILQTLQLDLLNEAAAGRLRDWLDPHASRCCSCPPEPHSCASRLPLRAVRPRRRT